MSEDEALSSSEEEQSEDGESEYENSDEELQEAFAAGLLKPGLNRVYQKIERKLENDVVGLKQRLTDLVSVIGERAPWIERLDMVSGTAPLAPELAMQEQEHAKKRKEQIKRDITSIKQKKKERTKALEKIAKLDIGEDPVHNDFKRELMFYRQAQSAVLEALPRLKSLKVPTKRPADYFAQMAKTDEHMQKIRHKLVEKQMTEERLEKVRKLREMKKFGKKVQVEVQQKREKDKRDMLEQVKKFRKGKIESLDFLEDEENDKKKNKKIKNEKSGQKPQGKLKMKNEKFGFGGKKRGMKRNTKESADDVSGFRQARRPGFKAHGKKNQRPGKARRQKMKGGKK